MKACKHIMSAILGLVVLSACGSGDTPNGSNEPAQNLDPQLDRAAESGAAIGTTGGAVQAVARDGRSYNLTIPPETLQTEADIRLTPVTDIGSPAYVERFIAGVQFDPDGLQFDQAATLDITLPESELDYEKLMALAWSGNGENVSLKLVLVVDGKLRLRIGHFSGVALVSGNAKAAAAATGKQAAYPIEQRYIGLMTQFVQQRLTASATPEDYMNAIDAATDQYAIPWLNEIASSLEEQAATPENIRQAVSEVATWEEHLLNIICATIDCDNRMDSLLDNLKQVKTRIVSTLITAFERASENKDDALVLKLITEAELMDLQYASLITERLGLSSELSLAQALEYRYARQLLIDLTDFPETLTVGGDAKVFSLRFSLAKTGEPVPGLAVTVGPQFDGCGLITVDDAAPVRDTLSLVTDRSGNIENLSLAAGTTCSEPLDQSLIHVTTENSLERTDELHGEFLSRHEIYSAENVGEQLVINVRGFPQRLVQGGDSVDFSVRFSLLSNDRPLAGAEVFIGPNNQGCATINGSRGYDAYTTDANGEVTGLSLAANTDAGCTAPTDRSLVYIRVDDATVAKYTDSDQQLGTEVIYEAGHGVADLVVDNAYWSVSALASTLYCDNAKASLCDVRTTDDAYFSEYPLPSSLVYGQNFSSSSRGSTMASANVTIDLSMQTMTAAGNLLEVRYSSQLSIDTAIGFEADRQQYAASYAQGKSENSGAITFTIADRSRSYTIEWTRSGFAAAPPVFDPRATYVKLTGPGGGQVFTSDPQYGSGGDTALNTLSLSGDLPPGKYTLSAICSEGENFAEMYYDGVAVSNSSYSDAGSCAFDFIVK